MKQDRLLSKPAAYGFFGFVGFLFTFCCLTGRDLAAWGNILWTAGYAVRTLGVSLAAGGILGGMICFGFRKAARGTVVCAGYSAQDALHEEQGTGSRVRNVVRGEQGTGSSVWNVVCGEQGTGSSVRNVVRGEQRTGCRTGGGKVFVISQLLAFLAWLPGFLAYYPAICAYDTPVQLGQIIDNSYNDHHPIAHTLLVKWALRIGESIFKGPGAANAGIAVYALLQMAFLASVFALGVSWLWRKGTRRIWLVLVQLFCMLYPFGLYMSISVTKDTVFSAFFLLMLLALSEAMDTCRRKDFALFFVAAVGMILFRNNGKYAFLVYLVVLSAAALFGKKRRRLWTRLVLWSLGAFLAGNAALAGIYRLTDARQGDRREMLCLPIQQLARTMVYHGGVGMLPEDDGAMDEKDRALINDFILNEGYRNYRPDFTDPVKRSVNTYVARYRTGDFLSTYLGLFVRYPGDYLNAALAVDAGYLYPGDVSHAYVNAQEGQAAGGGYVQTRWEEGALNARGIFKDSKWPRLFGYMEKWADENAYLNLPILKYLFVPGVWIWLYLLLLGRLLLGRRFGDCIPLSLVFGYFLTLLLGPTVQLRYIYPIMIAFPFLLLSGFCRRDMGAGVGAEVDLCQGEGGDGR